MRGIVNFMKKKYTILAVDDEEGVRESLKILLSDDYYVITARNGAEAISRFKEIKVDLVFLDIRMPGMSGIEVLDALKNMDSLVEVVMLTATVEVGIAVKAIHKGARHYLTKPFDIDDLMALVEKLLKNRDRARAQIQASEQTSPSPFLLVPSMEDVRMAVEEMRSAPHSTIFLGAKGTESEGMAYLIHRQSMNEHFVVISCTGSIEGIAGVDHIIPGSTIFFSRIDLLSLTQQKILLEHFQAMLIQDPHFFQRICIVSSTEVKMETKIHQGLWDEELFHYINGDTIVLPSLTERRTDLPAIIEYYIASYNTMTGKKVVFPPEAIEFLAHYTWPGNITEMKNIIHMIMLRKSVDGVVLLEELPLLILANADVSLLYKTKSLSLSSFTDYFEQRYSLQRQ